MQGFCRGPWNCIKYGAEQYGLRYLQPETYCVAMHEAGHAVLALRWGVTVTRVTLDPETHSGGECRYALDRPHPSSHVSERTAWAGKELLITLGGIMATEEIDGALQSYDRRSVTDEDQILEALEAWADPDASGRTILKARDSVRATLKEHRRELDAIASGLLVLRTLDADDLRRLAPDLVRRCEAFQAAVSAVRVTGEHHPTETRSSPGWKPIVYVRDIHERAAEMIARNSSRQRGGYR